MTQPKQYLAPYPILDRREEEALEKLTVRYNKLIEPSKLFIAGKKLSGIIPESVKKAGVTAKNTITEQELFANAMSFVSTGFKTLEQYAAKFTISPKVICQKVNANVIENDITEINELCFARSYDLSKFVNNYRTQDLLLAFAEGGGTGYFGFAGLPANLVLSTFLFYRAVQSVAMHYGYDVQSDPSELVIASEVFTNAMNPSQIGNADEMAAMISKIMVMAETTTIRQLANKSWAEMASHGGTALLITQMRALANASARKALTKAGKAELEQTLFTNVLKLIGKKLSQDAIKKSIPYISAGIGAFFDTAQMNQVLEYADIFYHKRFLLEKSARIAAFVDGSEAEVIEILPTDETSLPVE